MILELMNRCPFIPSSQALRRYKSNCSHKQWTNKQTNKQTKTIKSNTYSPTPFKFLLWMCCAPAVTFLIDGNETYSRHVSFRERDVESFPDHWLLIAPKTWLKLRDTLSSDWAMPALSSATKKQWRCYYHRNFHKFHANR